MNERTKDIAYNTKLKTGAIVGSDEWQQVFAELIVRECAKVVTLWSDEEPCSEGYDIHLVHKMKEHFGIE